MKTRNLSKLYSLIIEATIRYLNSRHQGLTVFQLELLATQECGNHVVLKSVKHHGLTLVWPLIMVHQHWYKILACLTVQNIIWNAKIQVASYVEFLSDKFARLTEGTNTWTYKDVTRKLCQWQFSNFVIFWNPKGQTATSISPDLGVMYSSRNTLGLVSIVMTIDYGSFREALMDCSVLSCDLLDLPNLSSEKA